MDDSIWVGVRERVQSLIAAPAGDRVFGAIGHKFFLEDPLTPAELADLESQMGVSLPGEYRDFLLWVGAGGAGPSYGVYPVRLIQGRWRWEGDGADLADLSRLAEPFPREGADPEAVQSLLAEHPEEEDFEDIEDFDDAIEAWEGRWNP
ncbi:SMI1/KNR4 family protein [Streptomyces sp. H021]|uniref:SMI1/KNR4 family protein n=1 Tax=Streptomyces sp. H021 TaxID=1519486 RepID=UPI000A563D9A|nr:SMI1/KNR4 family protein [Streptomyces sp. H021]